MSSKTTLHRAIRNLVYSAACLALCLVLPFLTGQIPQVGSMLCPMHIPVLLAGFLCGPWWAMAVGLVGCFTLLGSFFELQASLPSVQLVMAVLLIMTPTVFFAMQRTFDFGDRVVAHIRRKLRKRKIMKKG